MLGGIRRYGMYGRKTGTENHKAQLNGDNGAHQGQMRETHFQSQMPLSKASWFGEAEYVGGLEAVSCGIR